MVNFIKFVLYGLLSIPFFVVIFTITIKIHTFLKTHILFSITILTVICGVILLLLKAKFIKDNFFKHKKLYLVSIIAPISISIYLAFIMGSSLPLKDIFNTAFPIKIIYSEQKNGLQTFNNIFPFGKVFWPRLWHDLPLPWNRKAFPIFHCIASSDFVFYGDENNIDFRKNLQYRLKNLGEKRLVLKRVKKISIGTKSNPEIDQAFVLNDVMGLANIINYRNTENTSTKKPIVVYPMEEIILFSILPHFNRELVRIEVEIEYTEYPQFDGPVKTCYQIDEIKFEENSPKVLPAKTRYHVIY